MKKDRIFHKKSEQIMGKKGPLSGKTSQKNRKRLQIIDYLAEHARMQRV